MSGGQIAMHRRANSGCPAILTASNTASVLSATSSASVTEKEWSFPRVMRQPSFADELHHEASGPAGDNATPLLLMSRAVTLNVWPGTGALMTAGSVNAASLSASAALMASSN